MTFSKSFISSPQNMNDIEKDESHKQGKIHVNEIGKNNAN